MESSKIRLTNLTKKKTKKKIRHKNCKNKTLHKLIYPSTHKLSIVLNANQRKSSKEKVQNYSLGFLHKDSDFSLSRLSPFISKFVQKPKSHETKQNKTKRKRKIIKSKQTKNRKNS